MNWRKAWKSKRLRLVVYTLSIVLFGTIFWLAGVERLEQFAFDSQYDNPYVHEPRQIDSILKCFPLVTKTKLPASLIESTGLNKVAFAKMTEHQQFYCLRKRDLYRKIVGDFRIKDFFSQDMGYYSHLYFSNDTLYWGINKKILYKLILLQNVLEQKGYDRNAMKVRFGHRSPQLNSLIHGASRSRHIAGEAVDITIGDINKSGNYSNEDKAIVLEICEKDVIGNEGGLGLYPDTRVVHLDVRGHRARWNSY